MALFTASLGFAHFALSANKLPLDSDDLLGFRDGLSRSQLFDRCARLGVLPPFSTELDGADPSVSAQIEATALPLFRQAGLLSVGDETYRHALESRNHAIGGIFDPHTGQLRRDRRNSVFTGALQDFFLQERLDCVATLKVVEESVNASEATVSWSGVAERVDGQLTSAIFGRPPTRGFGSLLAISLQLQILDRSGKMLFDRRGGIQLASYVDASHSHGINDFLVVPGEKRLQDPKRIERALSVVTQPLRYSSEEIYLSRNDRHKNPMLMDLHELAPPPPGLPPGQRMQGLKVPRGDILKSVHRVALQMGTAGGISVSTAILDHFRDEVRTELQSLQWEAIETRNITPADLEALGSLYDPFTGMRDKSKVAEVTRILLEGASSPPPDALINVVLLTTFAPHRSGFAEWEGAQQDAVTLGPATTAHKVFVSSNNRAAGEGFVVASAVRVLVSDAAGNLLYEGQGGIELLEKIDAKLTVSGGHAFQFETFTKRDPKELFQDPTRIQGAVRFALHDLVAPQGRADSDRR